MTKRIHKPLSWHPEAVLEKNGWTNPKTGEILRSVKRKVLTSKPEEPVNFISEVTQEQILPEPEMELIEKVEDVPVLNEVVEIAKPEKKPRAKKFKFL